MRNIPVYVIPPIYFMCAVQSHRQNAIIYSVVRENRAHARDWIRMPGYVPFESLAFSFFLVLHVQPCGWMGGWMGLGFRAQAHSGIVQNRAVPSSFAYLSSMITSFVTSYISNLTAMSSHFIPPIMHTAPSECTIGNVDKTVAAASKQVY